MAKRFESLEAVPLVPVEKFFSEHPDASGYFRYWSAGPIGPIGTIGIGEEFENPLPLRVYTTPTWPQGALPGSLGKSAEGVAKSHQVPRAFSGASHVFAVSMAALRRFDIAITEEWVELMPFWVLPVLESGERKSAMVQYTIRPFTEWQVQKDEETLECRLLLKGTHQVLQSRAEKLRKDATRLDDESERYEKIQEARDAEVAANKIEVPPPIKFSVTDSTSEGMVKLLDEHGGRMSVVTAEGKQLANITGRYTQNQTIDVDIYNQSTHGDDVSTARAGSESRNIHNPEISMLQAVQPEVIRNLRNAGALKGVGFFARCYPVLPESLVGRRVARPGDLEEGVEEGYKRVIKNILDLPECDPDHMRMLRFSEAADKLLIHLHDWVETRMAHGKEYASHKEWANKFVGYTARVAAFIHLAKWADLPDAERLANLPQDVFISESTMRQAIRIGFCFLEHFRAVFGVREHDQVASRAEIVLSELRKISDLSITRRDLMRRPAMSKVFESPQELHPALELLQEKNHIRLQILNKDKGGQASILIDINPLTKQATGIGYADRPVVTSTEDPADAFFTWVASRPDPTTPPRPTKREKIRYANGDNGANGAQKGTQKGAQIRKIRPDLEVIKGGATPEDAVEVGFETDEPRVEPGVEPVEYELVDSEAGVSDMLDTLKKAKVLGVDTETLGLEYWQTPVRLISITDDSEAERTWLVDLWKVSEGARYQILQALEQRRLIFHNALFDLLILKHLGMGWPEGGVVCTQILSQIYWNGDLSKKNTLSAVAKREVKETVYDFNKDEEDWTIECIDEKHGDYAARDTKFLHRIEKKLREHIAKDGGLDWVVETELKVLKAMVNMSESGMPVNVQKLGQYIEESQRQKEEIFERLDAYVTEEIPERFLKSNTANKNILEERNEKVNWQSGDQIAWVLDSLGVAYPTKEETGNPVLNKDTLPEIDHEIAPLLADLGPLKGAVSKWRNALENRLNVDRLMADWQQLGARSGRMSCKNPPLQGLPNDGLVRCCVEAPEGKKIISSDLSKIEVKVWAAVSNDPRLIERSSSRVATPTAS